MDPVRGERTQQRRIRQRPPAMDCSIVRKASAPGAALEMRGLDGTLSAAIADTMGSHLAGAMEYAH